MPRPKKQPGTKETPTCGNCRAFAKDDVGETGYCIFNPPTAGVGFPIVRKHLYCLKHEAVK